MIRYKLVRRKDNLTHTSEDVCFISFFEDGTFRKQFKKPKIGRSLLMSPFNLSFTWQTTLITKILEEKEDYLHFLTENSEYELFKK